VDLDLPSHGPNAALGLAPTFALLEKSRTKVEYLQNQSQNIKEQTCKIKGKKKSLDIMYFIFFDIMFKSKFKTSSSIIMKPSCISISL